VAAALLMLAWQQQGAATEARGCGLGETPLPIATEILSQLFTQLFFISYTALFSLSFL
jgi:hypothetical protein